MAKKPILVTITKTRHKGKQKFAVRIEGGKTDTILSQRYTRVHDAKRGARRKLHAGKNAAPSIDHTPDGRLIHYILK